MAGLLTAFPDSPRTRVFRALESIIRNDPILAANVRQSSNLWWNGNNYDATPLALSMAPVLRVTPAHGPDEWRFPEAFTGWLYFQVEMLVGGYQMDDLLNFWWAIQRAIYPPDQAAKTANIQKLQAAGARPGTCEFTMHPADPQPDSNFLNGIGQIRVQVLTQLST